MNWLFKTEKQIRYFNGRQSRDDSYLFFCTQSSWMLTIKPVLCTSVIKRRCCKKTDWTVCPGLIKQQAKSTIVQKRAWFVKADSLALLALQLQSIPGAGKERGRKLRTFPFPSGNIRFKTGVSFSVSDPQDMLLSLMKEVQLTWIGVMFEQPVNQWTYLIL